MCEFLFFNGKNTNSGTHSPRTSHRPSGTPEAGARVSDHDGKFAPRVIEQIYASDNISITLPSYMDLRAYPAQLRKSARCPIESFASELRGVLRFGNAGG
jgi:hypothetical protein